MHIIIGIIGVFGAVAVITFLSFLAMNGVVKAVIITLAVLIAVYSMARIQSKESKAGNDAGKLYVQRSAHVLMHSHEPF
jgi:membrane protein implicated in regulation of membrane protease activity